MKVNGTPHRTIWLDESSKMVKCIDQRWLPHEFRVVDLPDVDTVAAAISEMWVRGAPLIGAAAAFGVAIQMRRDPSNQGIEACWEKLFATRPTAVNLRWALDDMRERLLSTPENQRAKAAMARAIEISDEDVEICRMIGVHGVKLIKQIADKKKALGKSGPVNILTHCNAGWLATVDWGTATSPIYHAVEAGIDVHVWVDETRPRNQGAHLTAWEMVGHGVPHTLIVDNAGGHLMQHGEVDLVIVGTDRTTATGDVCNKIGTYLKALAAHDNQIPFYVALPSPTIDWTIEDGHNIPIEERDGDEVSHMWGKTKDGETALIQVSPDETPLGNPAFDVTPARLVSGLITERGVAKASRQGLAKLFPDLVTH